MWSWGTGFEHMVGGEMGIGKVKVGVVMGKKYKKAVRPGSRTARKGILKTILLRR